MTQPGETRDAAALAAALLNVNALMAPIAEAVGGYKRTLVEQGIGRKAADQMAVVFHQKILEKAWGGI